MRITQKHNYLQVTPLKQRTRRQAQSIIYALNKLLKLKKATNEIVIENYLDY